MLINTGLEGAYLDCKEYPVKTQQYLLSAFILSHAQTFQVPSFLLSWGLPVLKPIAPQLKRKY